MPSYKYRIIHKDGTVEEGESEARSVEILHREMDAKGAFVEEISEIRQHQWRLFEKRKVTTNQFYLFVHELISLIKAGVTLPESLQQLANRPSQPHFSKVLLEVRSKVINGQSLSVSMREYPGIFDRMFINSVSIGEKNGQLKNALVSYLSYLKLKIEIQQKVRAAFVYPVFLSLVLIIAVTTLFFFVLPRFSSMYSEFGAELPYPTQVLMAIVNNSHWIIPAFLLLITAAVVAVKYWVVNGDGRVTLDKLLVSLPWLKDISVPFNISSNTRALASLLSVGVPLVEALRETAKSCTNAYISERLYQASEKMTEGYRFSDTIEQLNIMDDAAVTMIRAGEQSGYLTQILHEVSDFNAGRLNQSISRSLSLVEPMLMLVMGMVVGGIIFVMYLPIFSIAEVIR